ncbi:hypothetical protein [Lapidilactobacillus wuchangensis]|uniref:hypothetical protein n=1 Tax=Lapidilactobacillus wuchangensis TaxID=2486001 RepID=UPI000F7B0833|nr:hypothetical protein [Lapidilactobacillus wuchangensis]
MNKWHLFGDSTSSAVSLAVLTIVLWLMEQMLGWSWLRFFVLAGAIATILMTLWLILQQWLRHRD